MSKHAPGRIELLLRALYESQSPVMSDDALIDLMQGSTCPMSRGWWRAAITRARRDGSISASMAGCMYITPRGYERLGLIDLAEATTT